MSSYQDIDPQIIERAKHDQEAFIQLFQHYADRTLRFLLVHTRDKQLAEDLTQETFITVMKKLYTYRVTDAPFSSWLFQIALNHLRSYMRVKSHRSTENIDQLFHLSTRADHTQWIDFFSALERLHPDDQFLLTLKYIDDMPNTEIATTLGISPNACAVRIHRALNELHTYL